MKNYLKILCGSSNSGLANEISNYLDIALTSRTIVREPNDNIKVKIEENVREDDVFVLQTSTPPVNDHFVELLLLIGNSIVNPAEGPLKAVVLVLGVLIPSS